MRWHGLSWPQQPWCGDGRGIRRRDDEGGQRLAWLGPWGVRVGKDVWCVLAC